jgi:hypothetical protein
MVLEPGEAKGRRGRSDGYRQSTPTTTKRGPQAGPMRRRSNKQNAALTGATRPDVPLWHAMAAPACDGNTGDTEQSRAERIV